MRLSFQSEKVGIPLLHTFDMSIMTWGYLFCFWSVLRHDLSSRVLFRYILCAHCARATNGEEPLRDRSQFKVRAFAATSDVMHAERSKEHELLQLPTRLACALSCQVWDAPWLATSKISIALSSATATSLLMKTPLLASASQVISWICQMEVLPAILHLFSHQVHLSSHHTSCCFCLTRPKQIKVKLPH